MNPLNAVIDIRENILHEGALDRPRARVIRQFVEALLFEQIIPYQYSDGHFEFVVGDTLYIAKGYVSGFGRIRTDETQIWQSTNSHYSPLNLTKLLTDLPIEQNSRQQLLLELEQTISLSQWNMRHLPSRSHRRNLGYSALESAIDEGHPYHPCFKARTGFDYQAHAAYGPECAQNFQLHWLAIKREFLASELNIEEPIFWQQELGLTTWQLLLDSLAREGLSYDEYGFLPVHPWQRKALHRDLQEPIDQRFIVDLGAFGDRYQASISVRTLLNMSTPYKAHIKLPLNMVNTSSLRTVEPHSVTTAPALSKWLAQLIDDDNWYQEKQNLAVQQEYAGIVLTGNGSPHVHHQWAERLAPSLSVIFRDSQPLNPPAASALPFVALSLMENDDKPFIDPWIQRYGCEKWVARLLEVTVIPVWHLLVQHGIALEAHGQNMLLVHQKGWPQKLVLRDFHESLEYVHSFLGQPELAPDFISLNSGYNYKVKDKFYWMSDVAALRELFVDTLFVYNLSELAVLLQSQYQYQESIFWRQVYNAFYDYQKVAQPWAERLSQVDLYQPHIQTESLLTKKLSGQSEQEFHHQIPNPLASLGKNRRFSC